MNSTAITIKHSHRRGRVVALSAALAALSAPIVSVAASVNPVAAANVTIDLCARAGLNTTTPLPNNLPVWGYELGNCTGPNTITKPGGPPLIVNDNDVVTIALHNSLTETTSLLFQGQPGLVPIRPDRVGATTGNTVTYSFTATNPGTYLYEAGLTANNQHQVAMGLYGALIVRPTTATQAYDSATTAFNAEGVLVLGEVDTALNNAANKAAFDMRNFKPKYFTINGVAYPATGPIPAAAGNTVLLRYVNAGMSYHSMTVLGASQKVIAYDGSPLTHQHSVVAETFGPGQTADALVTVPAATVAGTKWAVYDANLLLNNSTTAGFGGMMTFITVGTASSGSDTTGPATTAVTATPNPTNVGPVTVAASVSDVSTGGSNVAAAEYFIDTTGANGSGVAMAGTFGSPTVPVSATITAATVTGLTSGNHIIYVHGRDSLNNWGSFNFVTLSLDKAGPATTGLSLTPNPSNGTNVALHATASDAGSGGSTIAAAEYFLGAVGADGSGTAMTVNLPLTTASLDTVIPSLSSGPVFVHARDAFGNWGAAAQIIAAVDNLGPVTSLVSANPSASNGVTGYNSSTPAVRIFATTVDAASNVVAAEGFIDSVGASGTGFGFVPVDGAWTSPTEMVSGDVPLPTVNALSAGSHTIYVHAKDALGNWGGTSNTTLLIDKILPSTTSASVTPSPTAGATTVTLSVIGTDSGGAGIDRAEWFIGTDPGVGLATPLTSVSGSGPYTVSGSVDVAGFAEGSYTIRARVRDAAGNWSTNSVTTTLTVTHPVWYSTDNGNVPSGVVGAGDDADIYRWTGSAHQRTVDASAIANAMPAAANVDGLEFTDATHFYVSFAGDTTLPVLGLVQDEDIVFYNAGAWSVYFDGTTHGLNTSANQDIDEFAIVGSTIYYSTVGNTNPTGVGGTADDADIYRWNGTTTTRFFDATANGLPVGANVDGISFVDTTHFHLSFNGNVTVVGLGGIADEDVVYYSAGTWFMYFDGSTHGLGGTGATTSFDLDAIDV